MKIADNSFDYCYRLLKIIICVYLFSFYVSFILIYALIGKYSLSGEVSNSSSCCLSTKIRPPIIFTLRYCFTNALILFLLTGRYCVCTSSIVRYFLSVISAMLFFLLILNCFALFVFCCYLACCLICY